MKSESGNVLFYILLAVVLFAALSFAVAEMMRGHGGENKELIELQAAEIIQYGSTLRNAAKLMHINDIDYTEISFENNFTSGNYTNAGCASNACKIFAAGGGGVNYQKPVIKWLDSSQSAKPLYREWYFPGDLCVLNVGTDTGAGCEAASTNNKEVIAILPWIRLKTCLKINDKLNIVNPGGNPPAETGNGWNTDNRLFTGTDAAGERLDQGGRRQGCFMGNGVNTPPANSYHFFQVLWAR